MRREKIHWGIIGCGRMAGLFAESLRIVEDAHLLAVASRTERKAKQFGEKFGVERRYGSYEELAFDKDVDVVYIATPHNLHRDNAMLCIENNKSVLCEKPFTVNAAQAAEVIQKAREKGVFLMEAMWTRFLPVVKKVRELIAQEIIGEIRMLKADFGYRIDWLPEHRALNPKLAGGALLDVGIYPVSFASLVFNSIPQTIRTTAHIGKTGVDEQSAYTFIYKNGAIALMSSAVRTFIPSDAYILGSGGYIHLPEFWRAKSATIYRERQEGETLSFDYEKPGYHFEAMEVNRCIKNNQTESKTMPLAETLQIMKTVDNIIKQWI